MKMNLKSRKEFQSKLDQIVAAGDLDGLILLHSQLGSKLEGNLYLAAREGHWPLLRYWHENVRTLNTGNYVEYAALGGHYEMMIWLIDLGCKIKSWVLSKAVEFGNTDGHLKVIKYLFEDKGLKFEPFSLDRASENNHFGIFKYILGIGHSITKTVLRSAATQGVNLEIIDFLIEHCKVKSFYALETKLKNRRKQVELESGKQPNTFYQKSPSASPLDKIDHGIHSREESENSTKTLSNHVPKVPAGALLCIPQIPPATNKLQNFQFSESSDVEKESEDLAGPVKEAIKLSSIPTKRPRANHMTENPKSLDRRIKKSIEEPKGSLLTKKSFKPLPLLFSNHTQTASEGSSDEVIAGFSSLTSVTPKRKVICNTIEVMKLQIQKEEIELKSSLSVVEGKKIDFATKLIEKGYTLEDVERFMKSV